MNGCGNACCDVNSRSFIFGCGGKQKSNYKNPVNLILKKRLTQFYLTRVLFFLITLLLRSAAIFLISLLKITDGVKLSC